MATTLTQTHPLLSISFNAAMDFTVLAEHCKQFAETLIESDDPALRLALCGRLVACLSLPRPTLIDPIPPHLVESLTTDTLPASSTHFDPGSELLCDYSLTLAQLLTGCRPGVQVSFAAPTKKQGLSACAPGKAVSVLGFWDEFAAIMKRGMYGNTGAGNEAVCAAGGRQP